MSDSCFNSHALRQFEASEAAAESRAIEAEDSVRWQFMDDCINAPDKIAQIIVEYEVDLSPLLAVVFKPLAHADLGAGRVYEIQRAARECFHVYLTARVQQELDK